MRGFDPSSSPTRWNPSNTRGMIRCPECEAANNPLEDYCWYCDTKLFGTDEPEEESEE